jgi:hypothetical protein
MKPAARGWLPLVHVVALFSLAITYPLLELLGRSPEFFVAHRLEGLDLAVFVLVVAAALPAGVVLLAWAAGLASGRLRAGLISGTRALLAAAIVLQAVRHLPLPGGALVAIALAAGALLEAGLWFAAPVRLFVALLAPALVLAPLLFAAWSPASALLRPEGRARPGGGEPRRPAPVVFVVFDGLPLVSLLDAAGGLDRAAYPNFAALADTAWWFRQTTSVADRTEMAIPAILTGRYPRRGGVPTASAHPDNLFTSLAPSYELHVHEPMTRLCPPRLCPDETPLRERTAWALADSSVAYLHRLLPADLAAGLPDVRHDWQGFWHREAMDRFKESNRGDRRPFGWVDAIAGPGARPALHFAHVLVPHEPLIYLPSGQMATTFRHLPGLLADEEWVADDWIVATNYQRHLLQVGAADHFLGRLLARLKDVGLFDEALIVVTSDHGVSFRPGRNYKKPTRHNFPDIMAVPFLLKLPGQKQGHVSPRPTETIDILPTVAAALQAPVAAECDGRSALDDRGGPRASVRMYYEGARLRFRIDSDRLPASILAAARRKAELFGDGPAWDLRLNGWTELVGRRVADFPVVPESVLETRVHRPHLYRSVDLHAPFLPAFVSGTVRCDVGLEDQVLAVAVNGVIRATARGVPGPTSYGREGEWWAMVRPDALRPGANEIAVYEVSRSAADGSVVLRATTPPGEP